MNSDREAERRYAEQHGFFWLPCPSCGQYMGGHEWHQPGTVHVRSIPTEVTSRGAMGEGICPDCAAKGVGCIAWATAEAAHWLPAHDCEYLPPGLIQMPISGQFVIHGLGRNRSSVMHGSGIRIVGARGLAIGGWDAAD